MTKEKLEKEAEEWVNKNKPVQDEWEDSDIIQAIIDTSEPREKRIEELKAQIEKMKSCVNCRYCIDEKCPWQPKGCGMKHWELRSNYV